MTNLKLLLLSSVGALLVCCAASHTLHLGRKCPDVQAFPNLSMDKVLGLWFVVYKTDTDNTCLTWNLTKSPLDEEQFFLTERRQLSVADFFGIDHTHSITATLDMPNLEVPSSLRIHWPTSLSGKADFRVFDTDYDNYMAVFECNRAGLLHRRSVAVLSRQSTIDDMFIKRVRRLLDTVEVSHSALDKIDHDLCRKEGKRNWSLGDPDLSPSNFRRKVGDDVVDYDISQIEIVGENVYEDSLGSFRGSIIEEPKKAPKV